MHYKFIQTKFFKYHMRMSFAEQAGDRYEREEEEEVETKKLP